MKEIGGFFHLELNEGVDFHLKDGLFFNTGRNALEYILLSIGSVDRLWLPYYTCDVILEPIMRLGLEYSRYRINESLEINENITLGKNDYLLVTNYFGIKDSYIQDLSLIYGDHLIVDNSQAFFSKPIAGIKTFYSPRKFLGVPDGGIAFVEGGRDLSPYQFDVSFDRCSHLLKRFDLGAERSYNDYKRNNYKLKGQPIRLMSTLTQQLLYSIDYEAIKDKRNNNFATLHSKLSVANELVMADNFSCAMVYPFLSKDSYMKKRLIENKIFVATYWPNVIDSCPKDSIEFLLANNIVSIPIDQRYDEETMNYIINIINGD